MQNIRYSRPAFIVRPWHLVVTAMFVLLTIWLVPNPFHHGHDAQSASTPVIATTAPSAAKPVPSQPAEITPFYAEPVLNSEVNPKKDMVTYDRFSGYASYDCANDVFAMVTNWVPAQFHGATLTMSDPNMATLSGTEPDFNGQSYVTLAITGPGKSLDYLKRHAATMIVSIEQENPGSGFTTIGRNVVRVDPAMFGRPVSFETGNFTKRGFIGEIYLCIK